MSGTKKSRKGVTVSGVLAAFRMLCAALVISVPVSSPVLAISLFSSDKGQDRVDAWLQKKVHEPSDVVSAIQDRVDTAKDKVDTAMFGVNCAVESVSSGGLCTETAVRKAQDMAVEKVESAVGSTSRKAWAGIGKLAGKLKGKKKMILKTVVRAGKQAGRLVGPVGQVVSAWDLGTSVGTVLSDNFVQPAMEGYYRNKARMRAEKDAQGLAILRADRSVALEYRRLLANKGMDEANAFLDETVQRRGRDSDSDRVTGASSPAASCPYDQDELGQMKRQGFETPFGCAVQWSAADSGPDPYANVLADAMAELSEHSTKRQSPLGERGYAGGDTRTPSKDSMQLLLESTASLGVAGTSTDTASTAGTALSSSTIASSSAASPGGMTSLGGMFPPGAGQWASLPSDCHRDSTPACDRAMKNIAEDARRFSERLGRGVESMSESQLVNAAVALPKSAIDHLSACYASETRPHCRQAIRQQIEQFRQVHRDAQRWVRATW